MSVDSVHNVYKYKKIKTLNQNKSHNNKNRLSLFFDECRNVF